MAFTFRDDENEQVRIIKFSDLTKHTSLADRKTLKQNSLAGGGEVGGGNTTRSRKTPLSI